MSKVTTITQRIKDDASELAQILEMSDIKVKGPSSRTKATAKYQEKVGLVSKSYKLKADDVEMFKAACEANGESQAAVLTRLMQYYVLGEKSINNCWFCRLKAKFKK